MELQITMGDHPTVRPLSAILAETIADEVVTLGELIDRLARRGFGLLMIALALPTMIPVLPPGSSGVIGLLYIILAVQMLIGLHQPWLPGRARRYRLGPRAIAALRLRGVPLVRRIERYSRPRPLFPDDRLAARAVAVAVLIVGIVLFFPLPFLNTVPALGVLFLGIGLLNRDSIFLLIGFLITIGVVIVVAFGLSTLYALLHRLWRRP
ncbi:MAG TPA: exopolysaccharide biosynthesis protein [bacterium]|nr:exopolysaccharide biosynthesis protein [bacterium]